MEETLTLEQQGELAVTFIDGLLREFGLNGTVESRELDDTTVEVSVHGDELGSLIGPRGATLLALQDLARTVVQRQSMAKTDRLLVDVGGYREKRVLALRRFTEKIVEQVKETGTERVLEPMSSADRKVVHDTVNEIGGVVTRSEGEDANRHVVISPAE